MEITRAAEKDLPAILELQKSAYSSEAKLLNDYSIQPLVQTLDDLEKEFSKKIILKLIDAETGEINGSIRAYEENGRVYVGKLMVRPEYQNKGFGAKLLKEIESYYKNKAFELYTSDKSEKNLTLYKKNGYKEFKRKKETENYGFIYLEKIIE